MAPLRHSDTVVPVTSFFAMPEETEAWVAAEVNRLGLVMYDEVLAGGSRRCFLWPQEAQPLPPPARGVMVWFPTIEEAALTMGGTGWKASAFDDPIASVGRRLNEALTRSLRRLATVPLYAVSYDGVTRSDKPAAWGSEAAVAGGKELRQFRDGSATFEP